MGDTHLVFPPFIQALHLDKWVHFILWGILYYSYYRFNKPSAHLMVGRIWIPLILILLGGIVEILQHYMEWGRTGDVYDFIADALGVIVVVWSTHRK